MSKSFLFQTIQFSISTQFTSIWPINRALSGATTLGQDGPRGNGNEEVLRIPQSSRITGTSPSDCLMSYIRTLVGMGNLPLVRDAGFILQAQPTRQVCMWGREKEQVCVCVCVWKREKGERKRKRERESIRVCEQVRKNKILITFIFIVKFGGPFKKPRRPHVTHGPQFARDCFILRYIFFYNTEHTQCRSGLE